MIRSRHTHRGREGEGEGEGERERVGEGPGHGGKALGEVSENTEGHVRRRTGHSLCCLQPQICHTAHQYIIHMHSYTTQCIIMCYTVGVYIKFVLRLYAA